MKRYLTLKKRVKASDKPYHPSIQHNYAKAKKERELEKIQPKLL
jgi:hypothetical protein